MRMNVLLFSLMDLLEPFRNTEVVTISRNVEELSTANMMETLSKASRMVFDLFNAQVMLHKKEQQRQVDLMLDRVKDIPTRLAAKQASFVNINARQPPLEQLAS